MESQLANLLPLASYREKRQHIFPSQGSLDWFLRTHRSKLARTGALLMLAGRWFVAPEEFDAYVLTVGAANARD
jgi:hypothetical protein